MCSILTISFTRPVTEICLFYRETTTKIIVLKRYSVFTDKAMQGVVVENMSVYSPFKEIFYLEQTRLFRVSLEKICLFTLPLKRYSILSRQDYSRCCCRKYICYTPFKEILYLEQTRLFKVSLLKICLIQSL